MAIEDNLDRIKTAIYGEDVRDAIHDAIEECYTDSTNGSINSNARNLLRYVLERVAYTQQGMQPFVNALIEALAYTGDTPSVDTYMVINALTNVTNSNSATSVSLGASYTATLTPDTDYTIDSVVITMGGTDITSTAYSNGEINISSVVGDVVITASAVAPRYSWSLADGDLLASPGAGDYNATRGIFIVKNAYGLANRRSLGASEGENALLQTTDNTTFTETDPPVYPIPVPSDATSCTLTITPNTMFTSLSSLVYNNGIYERISDTGWIQGTNTITFTAGSLTHIFVPIKKDSAGSVFNTEPSEITLIFNR